MVGFESGTSVGAGEYCGVVVGCCCLLMENFFRALITMLVTHLSQVNIIRTTHQKRDCNTE